MNDTTQPQKKQSVFLEKGSWEKTPLLIKILLILFYGILAISLISMAGVGKSLVSVVVISGVACWIRSMYKESEKIHIVNENNPQQEAETFDVPEEDKMSKVPKLRKGLDGKLEVCTDIGENEKPIEISHGMEIYACLENKKITTAKYCSQCGRALNEFSAFCHACGAKVSNINKRDDENNTNIPVEQGIKTNSDENHGKVSPGLVTAFKTVLWIILIMIVLSFVLSDTNTTQTSTGANSQSLEPAVDDLDVFIEAKEFVRRGLKAPATAEFPALCGDCVSKNENVYTVTSFVDSQNSFGAMLRSNWTVIMSLDGGIWNLKRMVVDGEVVYDPVEAEKTRQETQARKAKLQHDIQETQNEIDGALKEINNLQN